MLTEREKQLIAAYIPSPPDPELGFNEYYILDDYDRVQKVYICDINPGPCNEGLVYGVRYSATGNRFGGDDYGQTPMYRLYDNKTDCRNRTHVIDYWEDLRRKQQEELK